MNTTTNKRKKKTIGLILDLIILSICFFNIFFNYDDYKYLINSNYGVLNNLNDLNNKFLYADLTDAFLENYSIKNSKDIVNIYTINIDNKNILVLLKQNTLITDKTPLEVINDNKITKDIKSKLNNNYYYEKVLSNIDYNFDRKIILIKAYIIIVIIMVTIFNIILNLISVIRLKNKL